MDVSTPKTVIEQRRLICGDLEYGPDWITYQSEKCRADEMKHELMRIQKFRDDALEAARPENSDSDYLPDEQRVREIRERRRVVLPEAVRAR